MKTLALVIILVVPFLNSQAEKPKQQNNVLSGKEIKEGWQLLFDGKSVDNWKIFNGGKIKGWKVKHGILYNSGQGSDHGGDIITRKEYKDFELYLEWNISPLSNSGIFIHAVDSLVTTIYQTAPEYQISDDIGIKKVREKYQFTAACYAMYETIGAEIKPPGEWNSSKIIANGAHVEHWLNGKMVVAYELWSEDWKLRKEKSKWKDQTQYGMAKTGHVGLQDHGGLTRFRNIKIKEL